jgi:glycosidase
VYYGEEVGQAGLPDRPGVHGDVPLRAPMSWTPDAATAGFTTGRPFRPAAPNVATHNAAAQARDPASLHAFYKALIGLRNSRPSLARGSFEHAFADGLVLGFQRALEGERTQVLINYGTQPATVRVPGLADLAGPTGGQALRTLYPAGSAPETVAGSGDAAEIRLPPQSVRVLDISGASGAQPPR